MQKEMSDLTMNNGKEKTDQQLNIERQLGFIDKDHVI